MGATTGIKRGQAVDGDDPAKVAAARTTEALQKIKENRTAAKSNQSTISFAGATAGTTSRTTLTKRSEEVAARKSAAAPTQTMINQKKEFIQCKAKATPALVPKQAGRNGTGTLMEKLGGIKILSLEGDAGAVHSKGTLPMDWNNGLNKYAAIQGGNTIM